MGSTSIAELRAVRFQEFSATTQKVLVTRLRKLPPRSEWPRGTDSAHLARARIHWGVRELRRIEIAGGVLAPNDKAWLTSESANIPEVARMDRLDDGFMGTPKATWVSPNPDVRYDNLTGEARLSALETALGSFRRGWDDDVSGRAWDWMRHTDNAATLLLDFEASAGGGAAFPKLWERFGWAHSPAVEVNSTKPKAELVAEATRVLVLLAKLPEVTIRQSIDGIAEWVSTWQSYVVELPEGLAVWLRLWPFAVEATNATQPADGGLDLVAYSSPDHEPADLDTLNTPTGKFVGAFLEACPQIKGNENPFAKDGIASAMRDTIVTAAGRSGLIVRHRLIEHLDYFLRADQDWVEQHLISALLEDTANARSLWRALARRPRFVNVLRVVGADMVKRAVDLRLGRETRRTLVFSLVVECLRALNDNRAPAVAYADIQQMIRALDDEVRADAAGAIQQFVHDVSASKEADGALRTPEDLFQRAAAPFLRNVWPQERSLSTQAVSKALADLPATSRGAFVPAVDAIQRFLVPFDTWSLLDYGLFGENDGGPRLSNIDDAKKAAALLRLLDSTIGTAQSAVIPDDLGAALAQIEKVAPNLVQDPTFRRLATAARR